MNHRFDMKQPSMHSHATGDAHDNAHGKAAWLACACIALLFFLKFAAFALYITPLWDSPDEPGHYSYILTLSQGHYPTLGETLIEPEVTRSWLGPKAKPRQNWIAQHPPLFYALATPVELTGRALGLSLDARVRSVRLVNSLLGALTILGLIAFLSTATRNLHLGLAGAIFVGATPMFTQLAGAVSNDILIACTAAWGAYWYARWVRTDMFRHAVLCALIIGLGCTTKITMLVLAVPMFFAMAWRVTRMEGISQPGHLLKRLAFLWLAMFFLVATWIAHNYLLFHTMLPTARMLHDYTHDATHIGFFHFMDRFPVWQTVFWNFIALIGWMGTVTGKVITAAADGLIVNYYATATLLASFIAILYPLRKLGSRDLEWFWLALALAATAGLYFSLTKIPYTTATCIMLFAAVVVSGLGNMKALGNVRAQAWLLLSASFFILFFSVVYYYKIWGFYNQIAHVKGLHGRYFYPVLPWFLLLMLYPLRRARLPVVALYAALIALVVGDSFFLHYAFEMYGKY